MKKLNLIVILFAFAVIACKNDNFKEEASFSKTPEKILINKQVDTNTKEELKNYFYEMDFLNGEIQDNIDGIVISEFDFNNMEIVSNKSELSNEGFLIKHKTKKYSLIVYSDGKSFYTPMLLKINSNNDLKYFLLNSGQIVNLDFASKFKNNSISAFNISEKVRLQNGIPISSKNSKIQDCGTDTAGCVSDAYANHGWLSVGLFIETAFIPATAVAVSAACALKNCLPKKFRAKN